MADDEEFGPAEAAELWRVFLARQCMHCGGAHARACPKVRKFEFHQNGTLAAVEFWPPGEWPDENIQWPETLPEQPED